MLEQQLKAFPALVGRERFEVHYLDDAHYLQSLIRKMVEKSDKLHSRSVYGRGRDEPFLIVLGDEDLFHLELVHDLRELYRVFRFHRRASLLINNNHILPYLQAIQLKIIY